MSYNFINTKSNFIKYKNIKYIKNTKSNFIKYKNIKYKIKNTKSNFIKFINVYNNIRRIIRRWTLADVKLYNIYSSN